MRKQRMNVKKDFSFAQVPLAMVGKVSPGAFMLYAAIFGYCPDWRNLNPSTIVTQEDLKAVMGFSVQTISKWMQELHNKGCATVKQTGLNLPNEITLHGKPKRR